MERKLLCYGPECYPEKKKHPREELFVFHGKRYCKKCIVIVKEESESRETLINTLRKIYNTGFLPSLVLSQIKKFHLNGMTYYGINNTINYLQEVHGYKFELKYGIGLVKRYYYDGNKYHKQSKKVGLDAISKTSTTHIKLGVRNRVALTEIDEGDLLW